ncbi:hypothetical protein [Acidovorax sp. Root217]|uniref:Imm32 family immunity protein n=1 Tax=Acidovorax sp. Root217 TaxID=1736492 RepID=UPI000709B5D3|nr:hypothetical protein [Acidovorax sp. Root217]KRC20960.1 hypothetical protein ASE31_25195 [Acidovorax sp. Root217]
MKLHGYPKEGPQDAGASAELAEVTLEASPQELRDIAAFFLSAADEMDRMGAAYDHLHLGDAMPEFRTSPHLTVFRWVSENDGC